MTEFIASNWFVGIVSFAGFMLPALALAVICEKKENRKRQTQDRRDTRFARKHRCII